VDLGELWPMLAEVGVVRLEPLSMLTAIEWSSFVGYEINGEFCRVCEQRLGTLHEAENTP